MGALRLVWPYVLDFALAVGGGVSSDIIANHG